MKCKKLVSLFLSLLLATALAVPACAAFEDVFADGSADGTRDGYELRLTRMICDAVTIPVIASGGAGAPEHLVDAVMKGGASAALVASIVHYGQYSIADLKDCMEKAGVPVRKV